MDPHSMQDPYHEISKERKNKNPSSAGEDAIIVRFQLEETVEHILLTYSPTVPDVTSSSILLTLRRYSVFCTIARSTVELPIAQSSHEPNETTSTDIIVACINFMICKYLHLLKYVSVREPAIWTQDL